jgi:hypothetical protein
MSTAIREIRVKTFVTETVDMLVEKCGLVVGCVAGIVVGCVD